MLLILFCCFQPKPSPGPHQSPSGDHDGNQGTIKRCPGPESPARSSTNVPPRPPPPRLPANKLSSLGNETSREEHDPWEVQGDAGICSQFDERLQVSFDDEEDHNEQGDSKTGPSRIEFNSPLVQPQLLNPLLVPLVSQ